MLLRLSRGPALLALALPLAVALAFSDETLDKVPKSEGYCSRILRVQGTRREGYTEFSLRVEGDPDFYKPGTSYRGKWPAVVLGARDLAPRRAPTAQCRRRAHGSQAHGASAARRGPPSVLDALSFQLRPSVRRRRGAAARRCSPQVRRAVPGCGSELSDASLWPGFYPGWFQESGGDSPFSRSVSGVEGTLASFSRVLGRVVTPVFPTPIPEGEETSFSETGPQWDGHSSFPGRIPTREGTWASPLTGPRAGGGEEKNLKLFGRLPGKNSKLFFDGPR